MISKTVRTLGFDIVVNVPSSVEEFDALAKKPGTCLDQANSNVIYRGVLADFRSNFVEEAEKELAVARKTKETGKTRKNEAGVEEPVVIFDETEAEYIDRLIAGGTSKEKLTPIANRVAAALVFDPSAPERKPAGPKTVAKAYIETAQKIIDAGKAEAVASTLATKLGITVDASLDSLSRAIAEDQRRKKAELANEYGA